MILGIDIDDVITDTSLSLVAHAKIHETEICGKGDILDHLPDVMRGGFPTPAVKTYLNHFMAEIMAKATIKENAKETLQYLKEQGHSLVFITARGEMRYPHTTEVTKELIDREGLACDEIVFDSVDKLGDCLSHHLDLLVDDSVKNCEDVAAGGVHALLFTSIVNKDQKTTVPRVKDWTELKEYIDCLVEKQKLQ